MLFVLFALILLELLFVGWIDLKIKKISNFWSLGNIAAAIVLHIALPALYPLSWEILLFPAGFIVFGFILFLLGIMGAGDSKFLASLFLVVPLEYQMLFFEKLILSTMVTGAILLSLKVFKNGARLKSYVFGQYWDGIRETIQSRFSYAPVIVIAWVLLGFNLWK